MSLTYVLQQNTYITDSLAFDKKLLEIPVKDNGEKMVSLREVFTNANIPIVFASGKNKLFFTRETVAKALLSAVKVLGKKGYICKIEHAYRSLVVQQILFKKRVEQTRKTYPMVSEKEILLIANMYTAGIPILGAHLAGGAIDIILLNQNLQTLDMGATYSHGGKESTTNYFPLSKEIKMRRYDLCEAMQQQGFTNYPFEYWHFSSGDVCDAYLKNKKVASYAPIAFDPTNGETICVEEEKLRSFFDLSSFEY